MAQQDGSNQTQDNGPQSPPAARSLRDIVPGHFELYCIIAGVFLGILLGPAVLGRFAPSFYDKVIINRIDAGQSLAEFEADTIRMRETLMLSQGSPAAVDELMQARKQGREQLMMDDQLRHVRAQLSGLSRAVALVLAVVAIMVIESVIDPSWRLVRARLIAARYVLLGFWIALTMAQPVFLVGFPLVFFVGILFIVTMSILFSTAVQGTGQNAGGRDDA
jgi:hypothetical protein